MLIIVFRVILIYLIVLFYLRIMGKRQLGELQPFELVITLIVADIITLPMAQNSMPVLYSLIPLTTLVITHFTISLITRKSNIFRRVINGKPVVIVSPNGIEYQALSSLNMSIDDLMEGIRCCNYYKIEDLQYAIVETNGSITVIPKSNISPVSNQDFGIQVQPSALPINIIVEGKIIAENLLSANITKEQLFKILSNFGVSKIKNILLFSIDSNGNCYFQKYKEKAINKKININNESVVI